jgi:hypothetical protein
MKVKFDALAGENRSFEYLRKNPQAGVIVVLPGEISRASKGIRIYLEMSAIETVGELLDKVKVGVG